MHWSKYLIYIWWTGCACCSSQKLCVKTSFKKLCYAAKIKCFQSRKQVLWEPFVILFIKEIKRIKMILVMILWETKMIKLQWILHGKFLPLLINRVVRPLREAKGREESHDVDPFLCINLVVNMSKDIIEENIDNEDGSTSHDRKPDPHAEHHDRLHKLREYLDTGIPCDSWEGT